MSEVEIVAAHIRRTVGDLKQPPSDDDYQYSSLPLCVIDSVYSIGARYESTYRTVCDFCAKYQWIKERGRGAEYSLGDFLNLLGPYEDRWEDMATEVFRNRQRTSSRSGILKAEAVYRFAKALQSSGVETVAHALEATAADLERARDAVSAIRGQASGISFRYFLMLVGRTEIVKPDRMLIRFVAAALGRNLSVEDCERLILGACTLLKADVPDLTPALLDFRIWQFQRSSVP